MRFVITGSFINYTRDEIASQIENLGGLISSSISSNTSIVIAGENASSKLSKAQELGITIINENEFTKMLLRLK